MILNFIFVYCLRFMSFYGFDFRLVIEKNYNRDVIIRLNLEYILSIYKCKFSFRVWFYFI